MRNAPSVEQQEEIQRANAARNALETEGLKRLQEQLDESKTKNKKKKKTPDR